MTNTTLTRPPARPARRRPTKAVWALGAAACVGIATAAALGLGTTTELSSTALGTADPSAYVVHTTECGPSFGDVRAEGSLVSTAHEKRSFGIRLLFHRDGHIVGGGTVVASDVQPGTTLRWSLSDDNPSAPHRGRLRCRVLIDDFPG